MDLERVIENLSLHHRLHSTSYCFNSEQWATIMTVWAQKFYDIPELIGLEDIRSGFSENIYSSFSVKPGNSNALLKKIFTDYGILNSEKCRIYLEKDDAKSRLKLTHSFLNGEHAMSNAQILLEYAWSNKWSKQCPIPETITSPEVKRTIGITVFTVYGLTKKDIRDLIARIRPDYGILDEQKAKDLIMLEKTIDDGKVIPRLHRIFFNNTAQGQKNVRQYLYTYQAQKKYGDRPKKYHHLRQLLL